MALSGQHLGELQQMVLLAVSTLGTDAWSASISRCLARERGTSVSDSVIYATLKRLTDKGFLAMELAQPTERRRGRRRQMFTVTADGMERLDRLRAAFGTIGVIELSPQPLEPALAAGSTHDTVTP